MASFVYVRDIKDKISALGWKRTRYKSLTKWLARTGAIETPIRIRPGLTTFCHKLPDGRLVKAEVLEDEVVREQCETERALDSVSDYFIDEKNPPRWRKKALGDALKSEREHRKKG